MRSGLALLAAGALSCPAVSADLNVGQANARISWQVERSSATQQNIVGPASPIDGTTLWFPHSGQSVQLAGIDSCALPQWAYDPAVPDTGAVPKPIPCGALAKAWLKRAIGNATIACRIVAAPASGPVIGRCRRDGRDLATEMLRVGMARVQSAPSARPEYLRWQDHARSARYGMWGSYVLDMDEWRTKAIDKSLARRPIADFNLLAERKAEISPPFHDARNRPRRRDR
jgi:endonuclease YncB( thermonuclease family)